MWHSGDCRTLAAPHCDPRLPAEIAYRLGSGYELLAAVSYVQEWEQLCLTNCPPPNIYLRIRSCLQCPRVLIRDMHRVQLQLVCKRWRQALLTFPSGAIKPCMPAASFVLQAKRRTLTCAPKPCDNTDAKFAHGSLASKLRVNLSLSIHQTELPGLPILAAV